MEFLKYFKRDKKEGTDTASPEKSLKQRQSVKEKKPKEKLAKNKIADKKENARPSIPQKKGPNARIFHQTIKFIYTDREDNEPHPNFRVGIFHLSVNPKDPPEIANQIPDKNDEVKFQYSLPSVKSKKLPEQEFRVTVYDEDGFEIYSSEITVQPDTKDAGPIEIKVSLEEYSRKIAVPLDNLKNLLPENLPDEFFPKLKENGVESLKDFRSKHGDDTFKELIENIDPKNPAIKDALKILEAHANLNILSRDLKLNSKLINKDYTSIFDIAHLSRKSFVDKMKDEMDEAHANKLHLQARTQSLFLHNQLTEQITVKSNNYVKKPAPLDLGPFDKDRCECRSCESAVSPLAYLADLLDYAVDHIEFTNGNPISIEFLENAFYQPFGDLPASCEAMEDQVRQVRIAVEILYRCIDAALQRILDETGPRGDQIIEGWINAFEKEIIGHYVKEAYQRLLIENGTSYDEIRASATMAPDKRQALADRLGIALSEDAPDEFEQLYLSREKLLEEGQERLESLFGLRNTTRAPFSEQPDPLLQEWRTQYLKQLWQEQDHPLDAYRSNAENRLPIIDPDVIGPDDFRKAQQGDAVFDLWIQRHDWISNRLNELRGLERSWNGPDGRPLIDNEGQEIKAPDINTLFGRMEETIQYPLGTSTNQRTWPEDVNWKEKFEDIFAKLNSDSDEDIETANQTIAEDLKLTQDSFSRLYELSGKFRAWRSDPREAPVTGDEWQEVYSILVQAQKQALFAIWFEEEDGIVTLSPEFFWISLTEPTEGEWPLERPDNEPWIDPDIVNRSDLPDPSAAGKRAHKLWHDRQEQLAALPDHLKNVRETANTDDSSGEAGLGAVLFDVLRDRTLEDTQAIGSIAESGDPWSEVVKKLGNALKNPDPVLQDQATVAVETIFFMDLDQFATLMNIQKKVSEGVSDPQNRPTSTEWDALYNLLTSVKKQRVFYKEWREEEDQTNNNSEPFLNLWRARKIRLPRWRASSEIRQQWQQALKVRSKTPIIDPDNLDAEFIADPFIGNDPYDFWHSRFHILQSKIKSLNQSRSQSGTDLETWIDKRLTDEHIESADQIDIHALGMEPGEIDALNEALDTGENITKRLDQLGLDRGTFRALMQVRKLGSNANADDWQKFNHILIQAEKTRHLFHNWREEERRAELILSPDFFQIPEEIPADALPTKLEAVSPWRTNWKNQRAWRRTLQTRIEQLDAVEAALTAAIDATEKATLPALRDLLIALLDKIDLRKEPAAEWVTRTLLIDMQAGGCQTTSRVGQAIVSLQMLLESLRDSDVMATVNNEIITLDADDFDRQWQWLGSYGSWRGAMFAFLYPENLLHPGLRSCQTPVFRQLVEELRSNPITSDEQARQAADIYSDYLRDVCSLKIEACIIASACLSEHGCFPLDDEEECRYKFLFGRSETSGKVYWAAQRQDGPNDSIFQTFWREIPALEGTVRLIGATLDLSKSKPGSILLFAQIADEGELSIVLARYSFGKGLWKNEYETLEETKWESFINERWSNLEDIVIQKQQYQNDFALVGDFDGDGRDEIIIAYQNENKKPISVFWVQDLNPEDNRWRSLQDLSLAGREVPLMQSGCVVGDFDGDGQDEIAFAHYVGRYIRYWIVKYDNSDNFWHHLGSEGDSELNADYEKSITGSVKFAVAGDFDGDGKDEIAIAITNANKFYVIKYNSTDEWIHLGGDGRSADFLVESNVSSGIAADVDGDGKDEVVLAINNTNSFWVMKYDDTLGWNHLIQNYSLDYEADFACLEEDPTDPGIEFAVAGDFDGDGCDEIAVRPLVGDSSERNDFWVMDFQPGVGVWTHLSDHQFSDLKLDFTCSDGSIAAISSAIGDYDGDGRDEIAVLPIHRDEYARANDFWVMDWPISGNWQHLSRIPDHIFYADVSCSDGDHIAVNLIAGDFDGDGRDEIIVAREPREAEDHCWDLGFWVMNYDVANLNWERNCISTFTSIGYFGPFEISDQLSGIDIPRRKRALATAYAGNEFGTVSNLVYLEEAFYFVPLLMALHLQRQGRYRAALDWFYTLFDGPSSSGMHLMCNWLDPADSPPESDADPYTRPGDWLLDPFNPHSVAKFRHGAYRRFTLICLIRCLLEYADAEFTMDNIESIARARRYYIKALDLLVLPEIKQRAECEGVLGELSIDVVEPWCQAAWNKLKDKIKQIRDKEILEDLVPEILKIIQTRNSCILKMKEILELVNKALENEKKKTTIKLGGIAKAKKGRIKDSYAALLSNDTLARGAKKAAVMTGDTVKNLGLRGRHPDYQLLPTDGYVPWPSFDFCVPPNPIIKMLRRRGENRLNNLRNCRNIAGHPRVLFPYAAATDAVSGLPYLEDGAIVLPGMATYQPTQYRYETLIERAKHLVNLAQQYESALLSAIEKRDAELYSQLRARQDLRLAQAQITLQDLRVTEADHGVRLAELQKERAVIQRDHFAELLVQPISALEFASLAMLGRAVELSYFSAVMQMKASELHAFQGVIQLGISSGAQGYSEIAASLSSLGGASSSLASAASTNASILSTLASYERRAQEWQFQKELAIKDVSIGTQQVTLANDRKRIVEQERKIAKIQSNHANDVVEFLSNKFTNAELYEWMSGVLENVYRYFLQQARAMAKLAENQLAFQRQVPPPVFIQADYWSPTNEQTLLVGSNDEASDRRGLTGSARLLKDIYQLDQYAFETDRRKLQLTKTFSISRMDPYGFARFQQTGTIVFDTPMSVYDRDFPGHYLRLIKQVRVSVEALIPPTEGIRATLSSFGISRVVIGEDNFQEVVIRRDPESVALTTPINATGVLELQQEPLKMLPFESMGVDTRWEFRMPKASNPFDYRTIADIIFTIEYTALNSLDYKQEIIKRLDRQMSADRAFSFRHQFADQWYDLHHPEQSGTPMAVRFNTRREDFPPNIEDIRIEHILLYVACKDNAAFPHTVELGFKQHRSTNEQIGSARLNEQDNVISTRRSNAGSWRSIQGSPVGEWTLAFTEIEEVRTRFKNEEIEDILFVITYRGETPEWPE